MLTRFAEIHDAEPTRPIVHLPATATAWSAADIWAAHQRYAGQLTRAAIKPGQLVLSATGNSAASIALLLACRAVDTPLMAVDEGTTLPEILALAGRFGAAALVLPAALDLEPRGDERGQGVELDPGV